MTGRCGPRNRVLCRVLTSAVAVFAMSPPAVTLAAQDPPVVQLTVNEAIDRAIATSHRLAETRAREEAALAAVTSRRAAEQPTFSLHGGYTRTNHVDEFGVPNPNATLRVIYPDIPDNYFARAYMQWPIYTAGRTDALIRAAEAESRAVAYELDVARADLRLEVVRAYWALVTAIDSVRVVQEGLARADAQLRDVRSQFNNGLIPPNEVSAVEAQRARQQLQLIDAQMLRNSVLEELRRLTGIAGDIMPSEPLVGTAEAVAAEPRRAELEALAQRVYAAEQRVDAIAAARKPQFGVTGAVDYANPNPRIFPRDDQWRTSWEVGVSASWLLWDGGRTQADAAEAAATARALRARQAEIDSLITTEVRQRQLELESARAAVEAANAAVTSAAEARRVVTERFNVGVATSTDVLDAQVVLLQAELDRTRTFATIRLAEARLARALGR